MKKSVLALAALTAFAGAASAQSSITMYGRVDLSVAKPIGSVSKGIQNGSGSRLGMRAVEDLGGGLRALFNIETRFDADTGTAANFNVTPPFTSAAQCGAAGTCTNRFWGARSVVGLGGGFGEVTLGREYTTAFLVSQLSGDPWGWDTVASHQDITGLGGIAKVRNDSSVTWKFATGGFGLQAQIAEATDTINRFNDKPFNLAARFASGPLLIAFGHEKTGRGTGATEEKMNNITAAYSFGPVRASIFYGKGTATTGADHTGVLLGLTANVGKGQLRAAAGSLEAKAGSTTTKVSQRTSFGYHHDLSKRTTVYADVSSNSKAATSKSGYDVGLKHNF